MIGSLLLLYYYVLRRHCILSNIKILLQIGFIAGRYLGENIRLLFNIMEYADENDIPGLFLLINFEKAFDSISWNFLNNI